MPPDRLKETIVKVELKIKAPEKEQNQRCAPKTEDTRILMEHGQHTLPPKILEIKGLRGDRDGVWGQYTFITERHKEAQKAPANAKASTAVHYRLPSLTWQPTYRDSVLTAATEQSHCCNPACYKATHER